MREIAIWGIKGGQGKTLLAVHLAVAAIKYGKTAAVVDLDEQASALAYGQQDELIERGIAVYPGKLPKGKAYDFVFYDYPSGMTSRVPSQPIAVLCTMAPADQLRTWQQSAAMCEEAGKSYLTVLMRYDRTIAEERDTHSAMATNGSLCVSQSKYYLRAGNYFQTIFNESWNGGNLIGKRRREILSILKSIESMTVEVA